MEADTKHVYLVDDDPLVRRTMIGVLESDGYSATSFASGQAFVDVAENLKTGCVLLDVKMPDMDGLEVLAQLSANNLSFPVVMISGHGDVGIAVKAMRAGAIDFLEKPFAPDQLIEAVRDALADDDGDVQVTPSLSQTPLGVLRPRELEVLKLLIDGDVNKVVAHKLDISVRTVEVHRARLMQRLGVTTFADLIRLAITSGL